MPLPTGTRLGPYAIEEMLGSGGMGEVYRARDTRLGRDVAIKILASRKMEDPSGRARLIREAQHASILNHPNICTIHEVGDTAEHAFIVMEHVEGHTLSTMIEVNGLLPDAVVRYGSQMADALAHAHDHGVVHSDLKSANVVITPDGRAKVLDFGLARRLHDQTLQATRSQESLMELGVIAGTMPYMAPELLRGVTPDERTDIWALGVVLYEMVAGHHPFTAQTGFELSSAILREPPSPLPTGVPPALAQIIAKCLSKDPVQRYQRAGELRTALEMCSPLDTASEIRRVAAPAHAWRWHMFAWTAVAASLGLALFVLTWLGPRDRVTSGPLGNPTSLAILPLINATGDNKTEYLSDGISDALINSLSRLPQLRVMARGTVFSYKNKEVDPRKIGQELDVHAVFTGRLTQSDDTTTVQADLANASDGTQIWGERYTPSPADLPALQDRIASDIVKQLRLQLTAEQQKRFTKQDTQNATAYRFYLEGRYHSSRLTVSSLKRGIELMNQAIALDPAYALAYAGLADAYADASSVYLSIGEALPRARAAAEHALRLDPALAEAHAVLGFIKGTHDWQWAEAEQELQRTIALRPSYARAHEAYGHIAMMQGRADDAINAMRRAHALDPLSDLIDANLGWFYYLARRYPEALSRSQGLVDRDRTLIAAHYNLGMIYEQLGRYQEAVTAFQTAKAIDPTNLPVSALLAHGYALSGDRREAQQLLRDLIAQATRGRLDPTWIGLIHAALGDREQAFDWLEKAFVLRSDTLLFLKVDPKYDSLRQDHRFSDLVKRLNLSGPVQR